MIVRFLWLAVVMTGAAFADDAADFNQVRRHFVKDHAKSFARDAPKLPADSVYRPLLDYWGAVLELRRARPAALEMLRRDSESPYIRERAKRELAEYYLRKKEIAQFAAVADISPCASLLAELHSGEADAAAVRKLWDAETKFQDSLCVSAMKKARKDGVLTEDAVWMKLRGLAGSGLLGTTRRFLRHFPVGLSYKTVRKTVLRARRYIRGKHSLSTPANRALVMIAAMAAAKKDVGLAVRRWRAFSPYFGESENNQVWAKIAERAAKAHRADAMELYRMAPSFDSGYDENARAWRVRAALRGGEYADVLRTVQNMPESESSLSAWRYWRAAALSHTGDRAESREEMRALAADTDDYYGLLARESAGMALTGGNADSEEAEETPAADARGDFALALAVRRAGQNKLARRIWTHAMRSSPPRETLAAAREAEDTKWYLASINAADAAGGAAANVLRHPTPYRETIDKYSERFGLDRAFVYALIRRESRFMPKAVSSARARGLMQVLPSTAKIVARRHGYGRYRLSRLTRVDTNVIIGATYLHDLARRFDAHPARVAAAYNAGPGRAARWHKNIGETLTLVENIPLRETRLYVKALLAARAHYASRLGAPPESMRALIEKAIVAPRLASAE